MGRDGRGKRAAGAVRVAAGHTLGPEFEELVSVVQQVDDVVGRKVAALDHDVRGAERDDPSRRLAPILVACGW